MKFLWKFRNEKQALWTFAGHFLRTIVIFRIIIVDKYKSKEGRGTNITMPYGCGQYRNTMEMCEDFLFKVGQDSREQNKF